MPVLGLSSGFGTRAFGEINRTNLFGGSWAAKLSMPSDIFNGTADYQSTATDASGNYFTAHQIYTGSLNGIVLIKYSSDGAILWSRKLTETGKSFYFSNLAVDSSGNPIIVINVYGSYYSGYIVKYNSSGTLQWQRSITNSSSAQGLSWNGGNNITIDSADSVYVAFTNDSTTYLTTVKYNSSGTLQWQRQISGFSYIRVNGIAAESSGQNILVAATINNSSGGTDLFVAKYDYSGTLGWQKTIYTSTAVAASRTMYGYSVANNNNDSSGITISGFTTPGAVTGTAPTAFLININASGVISWGSEFYSKINPNNDNYGQAYGISISYYNSYAIVVGQDQGNYWFAGFTPTTGDNTWAIQNYMGLPGEPNFYSSSQVAGSKSDGNYIAAGLVYNNDTGDYTAMIYKLRINSNPESALVPYKFFNTKFTYKPFTLTNTTTHHFVAATSTYTTSTPTHTSATPTATDAAGSVSLTLVP